MKGKRAYGEMRTCEECGEPFVGRRNQRFCCKRCMNRASERRRFKGTIVDEQEEERRRRDWERMRMKARLAARDAEYERQFPKAAGGASRGRCTSVALGVRCGGLERFY